MRASVSTCVEAAERRALPVAVRGGALHSSTFRLYLNGFWSLKPFNYPHISQIVLTLS